MRKNKYRYLLLLLCGLMVMLSGCKDSKPVEEEAKPNITDQTDTSSTEGQTDSNENSNTTDVDPDGENRNQEDDSFAVLQETLKENGDSDAEKLSFLDDGAAEELFNGEQAHAWVAGEDGEDQFVALRHFYVTPSGAVYEMNVETGGYMPLNVEADIAVNWQEDLVFAAFTEPYGREYKALHAGEPKRDYAVIVAMQDDVDFQIQQVEFDETDLDFRIVDTVETFHADRRGQVFYVYLYHTEMLPEYCVRATTRNGDVALYYAAYDGKDENGRHFVQVNSEQ